MIPLLDLKTQYASIQTEIDAAVADVLRSGGFILGPEVAGLEREIAAYCGCNHGIGVASGTDALRLVMVALGIGPGDEVITSPLSFVASASMISHCGARPVFVDIDAKSYNLDPESIEPAITPRTKAILPVHLFGQPADMDPILELAGRRGLAVIEDCAQAIGARYRGRRVGCLGRAGCLSFYPTKNLGAYGDAGMVLTQDPALAEQIDVLRRHGERRKYYTDLLGYNSRLDAIQAAILRVKLRHLDHWNRARQAIAARYDLLLADLPLVRPHRAAEREHLFHQYTVRTAQRDALAEHLGRRGIATGIYYPVPLHRQAPYAELNARLSLPQAEAASREVLSLPIYPELTPSQIDEIGAAVRCFWDVSK